MDTGESKSIRRRPHVRKLAAYLLTQLLYPTDQSPGSNIDSPDPAPLPFYQKSLLHPLSPLNPIIPLFPASSIQAQVESSTTPLSLV